MSEITETILDLDQLLDSTLDLVEDLPDYVDPADGLYALSIQEAKVNKSKDPKKASRIVLTYKIEEIVEIDDGGYAVPTGSLFTEGFQGTADGLKFFKRQAKKLFGTDDLTGNTLADILTGLKEIGLFQARVTLRKTKNADTGVEYTNVNVMPLAEE
jgi:hypothetical protein